MYFAPFLKVWVKVEGVDIDISEAVASLKYKRDLEKENEISFQVEQSYIQKLSETILRRGQTLTFQFGFKGGSSSKLQRARIVEIKRKYSNTKVSLTVKGRDLGSVMKKSFTNKVWKNVTTSDIAREIAANYNLEFVGENTEYTWDNYPQTQKDDYSFLQEIVEKDNSGNLYVYIDNGRLVLENRGLNKASALTFQYGQGDRVLSFDVSEQEKTAGMNGAAGSTFTGFDPDAKEKIEAKAGENGEKEDVSLGQFAHRFSANGEFLGTTGEQVGKVVSGVSSTVSSLGNGQGLTKSVGELTKGTNGDPNSETKEFGSKTITNLKQPNELVSAANNGIKSGKLKITVGKLKIMGEPNIELNNVVTMRGLLPVDNGNYLVKSITHDVSSSGFFTNLEMNKNAASRPNSATQIANLDPKTVNETVGAEAIEAVEEVFVFDANGNRVDPAKREYKVE